MTSQGRDLLKVVNPNVDINVDVMLLKFAFTNRRYLTFRRREIRNEIK